VLSLTLYLLDATTYGELLKRYAESDSRFPKEVVDACFAAPDDYPFVEASRKVTVLRWLGQQVLQCSPIKDYLDTDGELINDDDCRYVLLFILSTILYIA